MDLLRAKEIVNLYGAALTKGKEEEVARKQSLLPSDKDTVIKAYKLFIAHYIEFDLLDQEIGETLISSVCFIDSFVPDKEADRINEVHKMLKNGDISENDTRVKEYFEFTTGIMFNGELSDEINHFINQIYEFDKEDPLYHQRIYTLAEVEYSPEKKSSFWSKLFR